MKLTVNDITPIETYPYLEVGSSNLEHYSSPQLLHKSLPIYLGEWVNENAKVDLIIICSDLQGIIKEAGEHYLLGEKLPAFLKLLIEMDLSPNNKIGVFLCGDLYTSIKKRGSSGDVRTVWKEFKKHFSWVVGVAGNHDFFGNSNEKEAFKALEGIHLLHQEAINIDGIRIGGISGIIGRDDKINRIEESHYLKNLRKLLKKKIDFVLLHESPDYPSLNQIGNPKIRVEIEQASKSKICCGHCFWQKTLVEFENETQVLNTDSKVVILQIKKNL